MKYIMKSVLALLLLAVMLTSCNFFEDIPHTTTPSTEPREEDLYPEPVKQLLAENKPYSLEFTSNGDGTCYVSKLYLNNRYETAFDIVIPEKSPAGDTVTGIDLGDSLTNPYDVMPKYLTWEQVLEIKEQVETDYPDAESGMVGEWWINAYVKYDISEMDPEIQEEMIKRYPIIEYNTEIGMWLNEMSNSSDTIRRFLFADITPSTVRQYYEEFIQKARKEGAPEEILTPYKELLEELPVYANYSKWIRYLQIPSTVTDINVRSLLGLMIELLEDRRMPVRGVVLPELDVETTCAIYEMFSDSLHRYRSSKYAEYKFVLFSQSTSSVGYEELENFAVYSEEEPQDDILAWRYVDGVPTLWEQN